MKIKKSAVFIAWEAALTNTMSTGDTVLMVETGHFASLWCKLANRLGIVTELIPTDWRRGAVADKIKDRLLSDNSNQIKAVCVVHNETSTGCMSNIKEVREAIDQANHGALLMVDTISSLASSNFCHDAGILGGLSSIWSPPVAMYLIARGLDKERFISASGFLFLVGAAPFAIGLYIGKVLTLQIITQSTFGLLFVLLGFYFGEGLRKRITQNWFEKALLIAFCIMGIRLIAVGLF